MDVRPFDFSRLPKVSRQEVQLMESLKDLFPRIGFTDELGRAIKILVGRELGMAFSLRCERIESVIVTEKLRSFSHEGIFLTFGLPPVEQKGVLEIDPFLAHGAIDKLLGGSCGFGESAAASNRHSLTDIEDGVLTYLFLKIFSLIFDRCGASARVHFRMEGFRSGLGDVLKLYRPAEKGIFLSFSLGLGERSGFARMILPNAIAQKVFLDPLEGIRTDNARELEYYGARLANFGFLETQLWAELGRTVLTVRDINALETGDVIRLEKTQAHSEAGRLSGSLSLRVGRGERGAFRGELMTQGDALRVNTLRVKLEGMEGEQPV